MRAAVILSHHRVSVGLKLACGIYMGDLAVAAVAICELLGFDHRVSCSFLVTLWHAINRWSSEGLLTELSLQPQVLLLEVHDLGEQLLLPCILLV